MRGRATMSRGNLAFAVAAFAGAMLLFAVGLSRPDLFVEDHVMENISACGFAAASLLALGAALARRASSTIPQRAALIATSGLSLILFLSEISFGARIFDIQMPQMTGGGQFDGGHDIVIVLFRQLRDAGPAGLLVVAIGGALFIAAAAALLHLFRPQVQAVIKHVLREAFAFRLVLALGMLASAVTLDLIESYKASILEEVLEFSASVVLLLAVFGRLRRQRVLVGSAALHDDGQVLAGVLHQGDVFERIAVDDKDVREGALLDDADLARVRVSRAG
jgi:hypothetical protein